MFLEKIKAIEAKVFREIKIINNYYNKKMNQRVRNCVQRLQKEAERDKLHLQREKDRLHSNYEEIIQSLRMQIRLNADIPSLVL